MFISVPITVDRRQSKPVSRAAMVAPNSLPITATAISTSVSSHSSGRSSRPTLVLRPVYAKNSGRSSVTTKSSIRCVTSSVSPAWRGMTRPITNAPKISAMPISSVAYADRSTPAKIAATQPPGTRPASSKAVETRASSGRMAKPITTTEDDGQRDRLDDLGARARDCHGGARARSGTRPSRRPRPRRRARARRRGRLSIRRSTRMRASTGKAVIDMETPMKSAKATNFLSGPTSS